MLSSVERQKLEKASSHNFDDAIRIDNEGTIIPYPEQEYDIFDDRSFDGEGRSWVRYHNSIAERVAEVEVRIIEEMHKNSVCAVDRAIEYIRYWVPGYGGLIVDEAAVNLKRRIKAGGNVMPPPPKRLTYKEVRERYSSTFT